MPSGAPPLVTLLLLTLAILGQQDAPTAELYVVVANEAYEDDPRSKLVQSALTEPITDMRERMGTTGTVRNYLSDLTRARSDLNRECRVVILTRDEAGVDSGAELPAWSLGAYSHVTALVRENGPPEWAIMEHPLAIVQHLTYLVRISKHASAEGVGGWMHWVERKREVFTYLRQGGETVTVTCWQDVPKFEPWPCPPDLSWAYYSSESSITTSTDLDGRPITRTTSSQVSCDGDNRERLLQILDMGTSIILEN